MRSEDPCTLPKALKNEVEIAGMRAAHTRDGKALTRFLSWFADTAPSGGLTEIAASDRLRAFRSETGALRDLSFPTISSGGPNGAVVHYNATAETNREIGQGELYLVDSGAQYLDGTTDVTRTIAVGTPSAEMKDRVKGLTALQIYDFATREAVDISGDIAQFKHCVQPVTVTHPITGRRALYVNPLITARIEDMPDDESRTMLDELFGFANKRCGTFAPVFCGRPPKWWWAR